jgi:L-malate glycosyltransferase
MRVAVLLTHIGHTTISYELAERTGRDTDADVTVICYEVDSLEEVDREVDTDAVDIVTLGARRRFDPAAIRRLRALLSSGGFDLLHTHHNFVGALGRALAPRGLSIVDTEHADHRLHYSPAQNAVNDATLWRADRVVANSRATLESFYLHERLLVPAWKRRVVYNGVDLEAIDAARSGENEWETDAPRVVTVGRLIGAKNHGALIDAFDDVRDSLPEAELLIVGDGPRRDSLERLVTARRLGEHVRFIGTVPRTEVYRILDASDVFALPSRSEGFCVALVEAMACGLAPVVSDIPVLHEVAGEAAEFADPGSPGAFATRLRYLLSDPEAGAALGEAAERRARAEFPLDRAVERYHRIYETLVRARA